MTFGRLVTMNPTTVDRAAALSELLIRQRADGFVVAPAHVRGVSWHVFPTREAAEAAMIAGYRAEAEHAGGKGAERDDPGAAV